MSRYDDQVLDEFNRPVPGVSIYVYDDTGALDTLTADDASPLANPLTSDANGLFYFNAGDGEKLLDFRFAGRTRYKQEILVGPQPTGPAGPPGDVGKAETRVAMAGIVGQAAKASHWLAEAGREGMFVFSTSDLSAQVAADPAQGIYVAPASDPDGSSGAWVRKFNGGYDPRWFGAVAGGVVDSGPAFQAAIAFLNSLEVTGFGYAYGAPELTIPGGLFKMGGSTLTLDRAIRVRGAGQYAGTVLQWTDPTATGFVLNSGGCTLEGMFLDGGFAGAEAEAHAINMHRAATLRDLQIFGWAGDGIYAYATAGSGGVTEGNCNGFRIDNVFIEGCRNGVSLRGADVNAGLVQGLNCNANRAWGTLDRSFLGNRYYGYIAHANGYDGAITSIPTACTYGGNRYYVIYGQEVWCSTHAPTGDTTDNQGWGYIGVGGTYNGIVNWVFGTTFRAGGSFCSDPTNGNSGTILNGYYFEPDQNPAQVGDTVHLAAGTAGTPTRGGVTSTIAVGRIFSILEGLNVVGANVGFGPAGNLGSITPRFTGIYLQSPALQLSAPTSFIDGVATAASVTAAGIATHAGRNINCNGDSAADTGVLNPRFSVFEDGGNIYGMDLGYVGGAYKTRIFAPNARAVSFCGAAANPTTQAHMTEWGAIDSTGLSLKAGSVLKVNGTQVVGAQGAAVADATDAASTMARLNDLLARLRAHGIIAT